MGLLTDPIPCRFGRQSEQNKTYDQVEDLWLQHDSLRESLETLEAYDFMYGFPTQNLHFSAIDTLADWRQDEELNIDLASRGPRRWNLFMKELHLVLTPADILKLLFFGSR
ncbi:hypothetical protein MPH_03871 [Macrophomina phaseolina MS6]|uniref:Uncharacterized protein n=1 Tax=Macrophomina phaseolina (strain MS6) TaxID=1126212 RepID=K2SQ47_MACPH|nr:hypothetical protein MPH_03871 [Macrophomina phaseolina MS6]